MNPNPYLTILMVAGIILVALGIALLAVMMSNSDSLYPPDDRDDDDED